MHAPKGCRKCEIDRSITLGFLSRRIAHPGEYKAIELLPAQQFSCRRSAGNVTRLLLAGGIGNRNQPPPLSIERGISRLLRQPYRLRRGRGRMGGYSSTPRKGKVSEEGGDESLYYAASGMQVSFFREQNFPKVPAANPLLLLLPLWEPRGV